MIRIDRLDHLVLTVKDIDASRAFYTTVLGMKSVTFDKGRKALAFGHQKINLHAVGNRIEPAALNPTPGSADLCLITTEPFSDVAEHIRSCGVKIIDGPVERTGAVGPVTSIYFRDPDGNLIEVSNYKS